MTGQELKTSISGMIKKLGTYKYALVILLIGVALMLLPVKDKTTETTPVSGSETEQNDLSLQLQELLRQIHGAGKTKVLLTYASGPSHEYQVNTEIQNAEGGDRQKSDTVLVSTGSGTEEALITTTKYPTYMGAVVVCEGADSASVRLNIIRAVSSLTGLSSDKIAVIKMSSD